MRPAASRRSPAAKRADPLLALRNIGPAARADLRLLGIDTPAQLAEREPDALYRELARRTGARHDPCVWDVFAAAIHEARTGEALAWWRFTPLRKARQARGEFPG
ncbi:MAG: helix-hairpin-helix domain-containing protein [Bauldia sp.]